MTAAAESFALDGRTRNDRLADVILANRINRAAGGAVIAPWEVGSLPDEWTQACLSFTEDRADMRAGIERIERAKSDYRQSLH